MKTRNTANHVLATMLAAGIASGLTGAAFADSGDWHQAVAVGSTGTIDEKDRDEVVFKGAKATIHNSITKAKSTIRYNLPLNTHGDSGTLSEAYIGISYRDNGDDARVVAKLKAVDPDTGAAETLLTFDSDDYGPTDDADGFRLTWISEFAPPFALEDYSGYYIEVTLTRRAAGGRAEVALVQSWLLEQ